MNITPKSISEILFCLFISPLRNKKQVPLSFYFSSFAKGQHLLTKLHPMIVQLLFCFASVCTTKDCKFLVNVSFFTLLINLQLQKLTDLLLLYKHMLCKYQKLIHCKILCIVVVNIICMPMIMIIVVIVIIQILD